jgi:hypothetical protein
VHPQNQVPAIWEPYGTTWEVVGVLWVHMCHVGAT